MITPIANWSEVKEPSDRPRLPAGAYVSRIQHAGIETTDYGQKLAVYFDIAEGEYSGHYAEEFKTNPSENKKWKGVLSLWLPKNDGSDKDEWSKRTLKGFATAVEHSNMGYVWDWDETKLTGKLLGITMRNEEWEWNGKTGWSVRPFRPMSVNKVRSGEYTIPSDKPLKNKTTAPSYGNDFAQLSGNDDDCPF